ncbi:cap-specific mRNA (nucleoside-2'-O-)-methyltransferase 1-like [Rhopilema esculentum]|uniref:cap-specific mRNA (nucleoside-2'-O-)-methyltransferase 1-like n=1 Tax=Rhopilema esculentum TaxID=499914 RepID=UPI0031D1FDFA
MAVHQMKSRGVQKLCYDVIDDKYFVPTGLHFFKCVKDPWSLNHSKSQRRLYFFNRRTGSSIFESPGYDSVADYQYCLQNRLYWHWQDEENVYTPGQESISLGKETLLDFIKIQGEKLGLE